MRLPNLRWPWANKVELPQNSTNGKRPELYLVRANGQLQKATLAEIQNARVPLGDLAGQDIWADQKLGDYYAISPPVYRAVSARANAIASAPLRVYRRRQNADPESVGDNHPAQALLNKVNEWWTSRDLLQMTEIYLCLYGSAFWWLEGSSTGVLGNTPPKAIWPLHPAKMRIVIDKNRSRYIQGFTMEEGGKRIPFAPEEIIWFRYLNPQAEYAGLSPLAPGRLSADMGHDAIRFNREFFRNGAMPQDIIFLANGPLVDEEVEAFYKNLEKRHKGPKNAHRPMIWDLTQGAKPERLGITQRDMEFMAALNFTLEDVARIYGVPPPYMYSQTQSIYHNVKEARVDFYTSTVSQEWAFLEMEINEMLMPRWGDDLYAEFDRSNILPLQEALTELDAAQLEKVKFGLMTINEFRQTRNMAPLPWGDVWWAPRTVFPVADATPPPAPEPVFSLPLGQIATRGLVSGKTADLSEIFVKRLDSRARRFQEIQKELFEKQRRDVLRRLGHTKSIVSKQAPGDLFNEAEWNEAFRKAGLPIMTRILTLAAQEESERFGLGEIDPFARGIETWLDKRAQFWATRVNEETARLLAQELQAAAEAGESIREIQARIERLFDFNDVVRSERIARTEMLAASNKGHLEAYEQSGLVEEKEWLTTLDGRERDTHHEANGQVVGIKQSFFVGGEALEAPGIGGSPENVINCRCRVIPVVRARKSIETPT